MRDDSLSVYILVLLVIVKNIYNLLLDKVGALPSKKITQISVIYRVPQ